MSKILFAKRFSLLKYYILFFFGSSFLLRLVFFIWVKSEVDASIIASIKTFIIGAFFDLGTISFFAIPYIIYLTVLPNKYIGSKLDRFITFFAIALGIVIFLFAFFSEIAFWEEFKRRFNFISVDYLIYTYEVVQNINQSYPIPYLVLGILLLTSFILYFFKRRNVFTRTFNHSISLKQKLVMLSAILFTTIIYTKFVDNKDADWSTNRYNNELSKTGIYSFFAAFRNNTLSYTEFYKTIDNNIALNNVKSSYTKNTFLKPNAVSIKRHIKNTDSLSVKPNVIFICIESLSGSFMHSFGSKSNITPTLDSLSKKSVFFTNLYATGTRTVRGMEAISLSIPPTPGRSIVKRKNNQNLFTIGEVFKQKGYERNFFYGGDGYFDNMNTYFGGNGFNIIDRGRGFLLDAKINTKRINIDDNEVTFENAWGICDEDIYAKVIKEADDAYKKGKLFFDFVMTTSNHRPYTYPEGKIDIPPATGRDGAVKYTDYAIGEFLKKAKTKPWFKNTVFVIMSDHCASSAGKWELDVKNYHIPALIINAPNTTNKKIDKLASQIDVFPTLFGMFNWSYETTLFGKDILKMEKKDERAFIGNYRKLGLLKDDKIMILGDQKKAMFYQWNKETNALKQIEMNTNFLEETISWYQLADYFYNNEKLKLITKD